MKPKNICLQLCALPACLDLLDHLILVTLLHMHTVDNWLAVMGEKYMDMNGINDELEMAGLEPGTSETRE